MEEISLREMFLIFRRRTKLIIASTLIAIILSGVISIFFIAPKYETFTTLMVGKSKDYQFGNNSLEYNDLLLSQRLVSTYGEIAKSRVVSDEVIDNLSLDMSYETFRAKTDVTLIPDTEIIKLNIVDTNPILAATIANETAKVFMENTKEIMKVENIQIIDEAQIPKRPTSPKIKLNIAIGAVLGLMLGVFAAFLLEFLDKTIKSPADVEKYLDLPVIGTIPVVNEKNL